MCEQTSPWKLRFFCSVDVIGSTAYKSKERGSLAPKWAHAFQDFFGEFPKTLAAQYESLPTGIPSPENRLTVWKFVGDEILFVADLSDYRHVLGHVCAIKSAVRHYSDVFWAKEPLALKASAWVAGFPVLNTEIELEGPDGTKIRDFVGPSVDAGFRIARFASDQRLILSIELCFLLVDAILNNELLDHPCHIHLGGKEELKGVLGGKPYPMLWVDMNDGIPTDEERLLGVNRQSNHELLRKYLRDLVACTDGLHIPFIVGDRGGKYSNVPMVFEEAFATIREQQAPEVVDRGYDQTPNEDEPDGEKKEIKEPRIRPTDELL